MKHLIEGILEHRIGAGIDGGEYILVLDNNIIIFANCGLKGWLKEQVGKKVTIIVEE